MDITFGLMNEAAEIWNPVAGVESPCADISYLADGRNVTVTMHFSRVRGLKPFDLVLKFCGVISIRSEDESLGLNSMPKELPKCTNPKWSRWTFPLLIIRGSTWLQQHTDRNPPLAEGRVHYALVAMNDLVQLLAGDDVSAEWVHSGEETEQAVQPDRREEAAPD